MTRPSRSRLTLPLAIAALAIAASACGVPIDSSAHGLPSVRFSTSTTSPATTTSAPSSSSSQRSYNVYFLLHGVLTPVSRPDPSTTNPVTPPIAIASLDNGPNGDELAAGYASALSDAPGAQVSVVGVTSGVITVALNSSFVNQLIGSNLPQAYGQIVLTLVKPQFSNITGVQFEYDNAPLAALLPSGAFVATPVKLCDYAPIAIETIKKSCRRI